MQRPTDSQLRQAAQSGVRDVLRDVLGVVLRDIYAEIEWDCSHPEAFRWSVLDEDYFNCGICGEDIKYDD